MPTKPGRGEEEEEESSRLQSRAVPSFGLRRLLSNESRPRSPGRRRGSLRSTSRRRWPATAPQRSEGAESPRDRAACRGSGTERGRPQSPSSKLSEGGGERRARGAAREHESSSAPPPAEREAPERTPRGAEGGPLRGRGSPGLPAPPAPVRGPRCPESAPHRGDTRAASPAGPAPPSTERSPTPEWSVPPVPRGQARPSRGWPGRAGRYLAGGARRLLGGNAPLPARRAPTYNSPRSQNGAAPSRNALHPNLARATEPGASGPPPARHNDKGAGPGAV